MIDDCDESVSWCSLLLQYKTSHVLAKDMLYYAASSLARDGITLMKKLYINVLSHGGHVT